MEPLEQDEKTLTPSDDKPRRSRYLRKIREYEDFGDWCDYCRIWTQNPEKHRHEDPIY